jgi:hypothetical protein
MMIGNFSAIPRDDDLEKIIAAPTICNTRSDDKKSEVAITTENGACIRPLLSLHRRDIAAMHRAEIVGTGVSGRGKIALLVRFDKNERVGSDSECLGIDNYEKIQKLVRAIPIVGSFFRAKIFGISRG